MKYPDFYSVDEINTVGYFIYNFDKNIELVVGF